MSTENKGVTSASNGLRFYQTVDENTGEVKSLIKYLEGMPKQYRFDAKQGTFNINGKEQLGNTFSFQPIAWRFFEGEILGMGRKNWVEIFFVDPKGCVSAILFHSWSVDNLKEIAKDLYYDGVLLGDVVLTVKTEKKENTKITPKATYYIASFEYVKADEQKSKDYAAYVAETKIYRTETLGDKQNIVATHGFYNPEAEPAVTPKGELVQSTES